MCLRNKVPINQKYNVTKMAITQEIWKNTYKTLAEKLKYYQSTNSYMYLYDTLKFPSAFAIAFSTNGLIMVTSDDINVEKSIYNSDVF